MPSSTERDTLASAILDANETLHASIGSDDEDPRMRVARDSFILTLHLITILVALSGNVMVCRVIWARKSLQASATNILIANLSASDILGALTIALQWLFCAEHVIDELSRPVGERICSIVKAVQVLCYYVSTFTMATIAYDRYRLVRNPLEPRLRHRLWIAIVWLVSALFASQLLFSVKLSIYFTSRANLIDCRVAFAFPNDMLFRRIRVTELMLTQYLIPLTITAILYWKTVRLVARRDSVGETTSKQAIAISKSKQNTIRMLIVVVVVFAVCWLPVHLFHMVDFYVVPLSSGKCDTSTLYIAAYWMGISSCCYNPFIYFWLNHEFRTGMKTLVGSCLPQSQVARRKATLDSTNTVASNLHLDLRRTSTVGTCTSSVATP